MVWTTLALTIHSDGSSDYEMVDASPFHAIGFMTSPGGMWQEWPDWVSGLVSGSPRFTDTLGRHRHACPRSTRGVRCRGEEISDLVMGRSPAARTSGSRTGTRTAGRSRNAELFLLLDGLLSVEVDGTAVTEVAPGAVLGELALLRGGRRQATLRATTQCRVARIQGDQIDRASLERLTQDRTAASNPAARLRRELADNLTRARRSEVTSSDSADRVAKW